MGITPRRCTRHVGEWAARLRKTARPYRKAWPQFLFRHEPVLNAATILRAGRVLSRRDAAGLNPHDIAAPDVVSTRDAAHAYARLYFRPCNPTMYYIEGVRKPSEYYQNNPDIHAPITVMLLFDAAPVLTLDSSGFSDGNMQSGLVNYDTSEAFFDGIDFQRVYHDGPFPPESRSEIIRARCAEVLAESPLELSRNLRAVVCRSSAERDTLLYLLGDQKAQWSDKVKVQTEPGVFFHQYAYVQAVDADEEYVRFKFHPRRDGKDIRVSMEVEDESGRHVAGFTDQVLDAGKHWKLRGPYPSGQYLCKVWIEGVEAYRSDFLIDELPF